FAEGASANADPEFLGLRDHACDELCRPLVDAEGARYAHRSLACVQKRTVCRRFSASSIATSASASLAYTVQTGSPARILLPATGRSAAQSGQSRTERQSTSCSA